jgi:hypothetical protein
VACGSITVIDGPDGSNDAGTDGGRGGSSGIGGLTGGSGGASGGAGHLGGGTGHLGGAGGGMPGGSGGMPSGAGGGAMVSCQQLQRDFAIALADAKTCNATSDCAKTTMDRLECGCPTYVTAVNKITPIRQAWNQGGCSMGVCTNILCGALSGALCAAGQQTGVLVCIDQSGAPTPN